MAAMAESLDAASIQLLVALQRQARLLSKQFLHKSALAISYSTVTLTHPLSKPGCLLVGYYLEAVFVHGLILFDAGSFHKSATCFLKAAATLDAALAAGVPEERCGQSSMSSKAAARSRANFANRPYLLYKAARCHIMMGEHDKAFTLLGAVPFRQRTLAIHYDYGRECQRRGKLDVAVASFKEVLRANPFAIELIAPMVRLGGSVKELEALLCGRPDVPPAVSRWLQSHIRAEAAAKDARFDFAIQQLTPLLVVAPVEDASVSGVLPAIRMDSSTAIFAAQSQATERCMPCLEPNTGAVFAYAPQGAAAEAPFILGGADSCAPLFAFGHTYVAERIMAFAAEYGDSSLCVKLNQPMGMMADPFGMPGTEFLSFALAQAVLSPAGHSHGQSQLASMCAQLKATMQTWQNNRQHSASWVVAGLLCLVQGDTHNAIRFVNTALQCDTYDELAMTVKGYILLEMGSHHAAANHFFTSNTRNPSFYCASGVVSCYVQLGNWQLALTHATNSTVSHALDHRSHALLGHTMLQALAAGADADSSELQQFDLGYSRAKKKFQDAIAMCKSSPEAVLGLVEATYLDGDKEDAFSLLKSSSLGSFEPLTLLHANILMREEKYQESVSMLQAMLTKAPSYPGGKAMLLRAEALLRGEDPDAAAQAEEAEDGEDD